MATLFVVATPIGNLGDMTFRAVETLKSVAVIACEDTRQTKKLLNHYQITTPVISYHQHSGPAKIDLIVKRLAAGEDVAVVTDAGTPGIADPGGMLVEQVAAAGHKVVPIPGVSAVVAALSVSGLPTDCFVFYGFIPHKKGRQTLFQTIAEQEFTGVCYESPHRIMKTLESLNEVLDQNRVVVVCRELTKLYEEIVRGSASEVLEYFKSHPAKGEFVIVISGK